jgi:hypothetical protein
VAAGAAPSPTMATTALAPWKPFASSSDEGTRGATRTFKVSCHCSNKGGNGLRAGWATDEEER